MDVRYGMIHGRFQPFHNGHLEYALAALSRCSHLIVGITNPDPSTVIEVLDSGKAKEVSGSEVRHRLMTGQDWAALVPGAVAQVLRAIKAEERLQHV